MSNLNQITHNLRDSVDHLAEGWQQLWNKGKNAITRFTPEGTDDSTKSPPQFSNRWGVLSAELKETESKITIMLEVPGMESDDFDIQIDKSALRISGHKTYASDKSEGKYFITERAYGQFERVIPLPCEVDDQGAQASYKKGVLELTLQKHSSAKPRKIVVS